MTLTPAQLDPDKFDIPLGFCQCGCGRKTAIRNRLRDGALRGQPLRFFEHHGGVVSSRPTYVVDKATGCWVWQRKLDKSGYGRRHLRAASSELVHRQYFEAYRGQIPGDLELDHLCRNRACVNPAHLEPVTSAVNTYRSSSAILTYEQVSDIRSRRHERSRDLAAEFGVSVSTIQQVWNYSTWREVS